MVRRRFLFAVLLGAFVASGCGSFVGRKADNFTAYYNTFYNARNEFREGVESIEREDQPVDRTRYLPLFSEQQERASNAAQFQQAIEKSADVLREHPSSKWVDDALLLIGKSYFYQQNYVGAEQKFAEVMELDTPLDAEARFWLARTLIAAGAYDRASEHLLETLGRDDLSDRWAPMLRLALGELYVQRGQWAEAAAELELGLEGVRDREIGAKAQFLLGQLYETLGRYDDAVAAFRRVERFKPLYQLSYAAQLSAVRVEGLHVDAERALERLRRMERDDKNFDNRAEMAYLRGRLYSALGDAQAAEAQFRDLLYDRDSGLNTGAIRGDLHYALAELYRDAFGDYVLAAAHFDTAASALRTDRRGTTLVRYAPEALVDSRELADVFRSYAEAHAEVTRMDSLLYLGSLDDEAFAAAVLSMRRQLAEEMAAQQRLLDQQQTRQQFAGGRAGAARTDPTPGAGAAYSGEGAGFLFHQNPVRVQEGRLSFIDRWGERPLVPNWRRREAIDAIAPTADSDPNDGEVTFRGELADVDNTAVLPQVDLSAVPRDALAQARMRADRSEARYQLANVLFLSMDRPDSAAVWYRRVIEEDFDQPVAQRAYYALAEVQQALGDSLSARRIYQQVLNSYPDSDFAGRVRERLGLETTVAAGPDSLQLAEAAYARAYDRWQAGAYAPALDGMVRLAADHQETEVAPRALLAAGSIYADWAHRDSLDLFAPLPLGLPDTVLARVGLAATVTGAEAEGTSAEPPALAAVSDSSLSAPTEGAVRVDTAGAVPAVEAPTVAEAPPAARPTLPALYQTLAERYAGTAYASRARAVLSVLEAQQAARAAARDSLAAASDSLAAASDSLAAASDSLAAASDSLAAMPEASGAEEPSRAGPAEGEPQARAAERGPEEVAEERVRPRGIRPPGSERPPPEAMQPAPSTGQIDRAAGGWTIVVSEAPRPEQARYMLMEFQRAFGDLGLPIDAVTRGEAEQTVYYVVLGQFETQGQAEKQLLQLRADGKLPQGAYSAEL